MEKLFNLKPDYTTLSIEAKDALILEMRYGRQRPNPQPKVVKARKKTEKALNILSLLTPEQIAKLQEEFDGANN